MIQPKLILPKRRVSIPAGVHTYFLLGPIRGGGDWQKDAILDLTEMDPGCYIVCPSRYIENHHELAQYALPDEPDLIPEFPNQTLWERYYLALASVKGCNIVWLPLEDKDNPRPPEQGPYGQDTYGEIGEWRARYKYGAGIDGKIGQRVDVLWGGETGYYGLPVIIKNQLGFLGEEYVQYDSLREMLEKAVELANLKEEERIKAENEANLHALQHGRDDYKNIYHNAASLLSNLPKDNEELKKVVSPHMARNLSLVKQLLAECGFNM